MLSKLKERNNLQIFLSITSVLVILFLTIGFSAFGDNLFMKNIALDVRELKDIRITGIEFVSATNGVVSTNENYNINKTMSTISFPDTCSSVTYKIQVTNFGNVDMGILDIKGLPDNLTYTLEEYNLTDKICDDKGLCHNGAQKEFLLTISNISDSCEAAKPSGPLYQAVANGGEVKTYTKGDALDRLVEEGDDTPTDKAIYYYTGNPEHNHVNFGGFCWEIVRTTNTGGVKMIYDGTPTNGKCNNTGEDSMLYNAFNDAPTPINTLVSLPYVGYMYNPDGFYEINANTPSSNWLFGNNITWDGTKYSMVYIQDGPNENYHYTCGSSTETSCTSIRFYYSSASYIVFTGGADNYVAKATMLNHWGGNNEDSSAKIFLENWYANNLIKYNNYLEDVVFCNDRSLPGHSLDHYNKPLESIKLFNAGVRIFNDGVNNSNSATLSCSSWSDQFSVSNNSAKLKYPIGLITGDEALLVMGKQNPGSNTHFLDIGRNWYTMTPRRFSTDNEDRAGMMIIDKTGALGSGNPAFTHGIRPVISLKPGTIYYDGDGTESNPYVLVENKTNCSCKGGDYYVELSYDFRKFHNITYVDINSTGLPVEVIDGSKLIVNFGGAAPVNLEVKMGNNIISNYTYTNGVLTIDEVSNDITITRKKEKKYLYQTVASDSSVSKYLGSATDTYNVELAAADGEQIYYFKGNTKTNHVYFGGYCWEIIRTTNTGGVKMIYDGTPTNGKCNNTGSDSVLDGAFNSDPTPVDSRVSLSYVGYMYNSNYFFPINANTANANWVFGNTVTWNGSNYILSNTQNGLDWAHHYTCASTSANCTNGTVRFYYSNADFIEFNSGYSIYRGMQLMLNIYDGNIKDSTAKSIIDKWYVNNLKNTVYENYLEDTVFCNDRTLVIDGTPNQATLTEWMGLSSDGTYYLGAGERVSNKGTNNSNSATLACSRLLDRFSVANASAKLTYPIGTITADEALLIMGKQNPGANTHFLDIGRNYFTMSPGRFGVWNSDRAGMMLIGSAGDLTFGNGFSNHAVRPVISLAYGTFYYDGDGTENNPYIIETEHNSDGLYDYTNAIRTYVVPKTGVYKLEVWGAQGGYNGGKGGYSVGYKSLTEGTVLYIGTGGEGGNLAGGFNGGGNGLLGTDQSKSSAYGGGGATHIALQHGPLPSLWWDKSSVLIVAGGGGGVGGDYKDYVSSGITPNGGYGGGTSAGNGYDSYNKDYYGCTGGGGNSSSNGCSVSEPSNGCGGFGYGGIAYDETYGGAGGGGGYNGGGASNRGHGGGGGGSGYIGGVSDYKGMKAQTIAGDSNMPNITGTGTETGHSGNGYAKITFVE